MKIKATGLMKPFSHYYQQMIFSFPLKVSLRISLPLNISPFSHYYQSHGLFIGDKKKLSLLL